MEEDGDMVTQDDSGFLRAGRIIAYANKVDKPVNTVDYTEFDDWIQNNNLRFGVSSMDEMRTLKADIINGEYPVDEVRDIYERMFGEDPGSASIAQKTGNTSEFTDTKGEYGTFEDDYEYEVYEYEVEEDEEDEDEVGSDDEESTQAVDKEFSLDVYRVLPEGGEQGEDFEGNMLGFAVDFPNSDVYVEWNNKIFPDPLDDGHVSIYSSLDDLETATGNETELVETISQPDTVEKDFRKSADNHISLNINGESLLLEEADTQEKRYTGLSKYDSLDEIDGMLFRYPREEAHRLVWRDMSFPVDVIHLDKSSEVVAVGSLEETGDFVQAVSKTALEVPHGFASKSGIEVGDTIQSLAKGSDGSDNLFEKFVGGSYHRARKLQQEGEQVSLDTVKRIDEAFREQVWPDEIQKSPSWQDDSDVDEETQEWVQAVLDMKDPMWDEYDGVPMAAGMTVKQEIRDSLTQPQGWSLDSIVDRLDNEFPNLESFSKRRIARQEVAGLLNSAKITALLARSDDPLVRWVGPDDGDTTDLCKDVKSEVGDGVPVSELVEILEDKADNYDGGTPRRVEDGLPHWLCRHTVELVGE